MCHQSRYFFRNPNLLAQLKTCQSWLLLLTVGNNSVHMIPGFRDGDKTRNDATSEKTDMKEETKTPNTLYQLLKRFTASEFVCDMCELPIHGICYHCKDCKNFDLCLPCHESQLLGVVEIGQHRPGHQFTLRGNNPARAGNVQVGKADNAGNAKTIHSISPQVLVTVFVYLADKPSSILRHTALVSRSWNSLAKQQKIWRQLSIISWPTLNYDLNVSNWLSFYTRRRLLLRKALNSMVHQDAPPNYPLPAINQPQEPGPEWGSMAQIRIPDPPQTKSDGKLEDENYNRVAVLIANNDGNNDALHPIENCTRNLKYLASPAVSGKQPWQTGELDVVDKNSEW